MRHTHYLGQVALIALGVSGASMILFLLAPGGDWLYREGGLLEDISVALWIASAIIAAATAMRIREQNGRLFAIWSGWLATLAAMRELDVHIWLNPKYLGEWGVRFRLDWWLDSSTSLWLRLGWTVVFLAVLASILYPPARFWRRLLELLLRKGDSLPGFLALALLFLFFGFVVDDLLRPVHVVALGTKQLIEETSETIGATLFCSGMVLHWRRPISQR